MEITNCKDCKYRGQVWKGNVYCTFHKHALMRETDFCSKGKPKNTNLSVNQPTPGHWLFSVDGIRCSQCNHKLETTAIPQRCPHCGSELTPSMYTY